MDQQTKDLISNEEYDLKLGSFYNDLEDEDAVAEELEN